MKRAALLSLLLLLLFTALAAVHAVDVKGLAGLIRLAQTDPSKLSGGLVGGMASMAPLLKNMDEHDLSAAKATMLQELAMTGIRNANANANANVNVNANANVPSSGVKQPPPIDCTTCKALLAILNAELMKNSSINLEEFIAIDVCQTFKIYGGEPAVCSGMIEEVGWEVIYVYTQHYLIRGAVETCAALGLCTGGDHAHQYMTRDDLGETKRAEIVSGVATNSRPSLPLPLPSGDDVGTFIQFSDVHFDAQYAAGSLSDCDYPICCRFAYGNGTNSSNTAGPFGEYNCDLSPPMYFSFFQQLARLSPKPDFAIYTGDDVPHDVWAQSRQYNLGVAKNISLTTKMFLPNIPVFPALGNHESFPVNQFEGPPYDSWLYDAISEYWSSWLDAEAQKTFQYSGYYSQLVRPGLRIVALNTMLSLSGNYWLILNSTDVGSQLQWIQKTLDAARANKEKLYFIGHVPYNAAYADYAQTLKTMLAGYQDVVLSLFFGHTHHDSFAIDFDSTTKAPLYVSYVCPSVTPNTDQNPAYRVYYYNRTDFSILDYKMYFANLTEANAAGSITWRNSYSFKEQYGMASMAPADFQNLVTQFHDNFQLFDIFMHHYQSEYYGGPCTGGCQRWMLCSLVSVTSQELHSCYGNSTEVEFAYKNYVDHQCD